MNIKLISVGAAGNKGSICAIQAGSIAAENVLLLNSTAKDISDEYKERMMLISDKSFGCAKEAETGEELMIEALDKNIVDIAKFIGDVDEKTIVVIAGSTDGGTGCGGIPVVADYVRNEIGCSVRVIPFVGFGIDETGLKNTVKFFTKLSEDYIIEPICNEKFLKEAKGNYRKAEELANAEFAQRLLVLSGDIIVESDQNIDDADLLKTIKKTGFATTEYRKFDRIKNTKEFNEMIDNMIDESKSFDNTTHSQKRMAVILNLVNTEQDAIDWSFNTLKERLGYVKEVYYHVQSTGKNDFIAVISSGSLMPKDQIDLIYERYIVEKNKVSKDQETFYENDSYSFDDEDEDSVYAGARKGNNSKFFNKKKFSSNNNNNNQQHRELNSIGKY